MASSHSASKFNPVPYIGISALVVLFAAVLDSCSSDDDKTAAVQPAAVTATAAAPAAPVDKTPALTAAAEENIKPIGQVVVADNTPPAAARSGEEVFNAACAACHGTGVLNAPKLGDKAAWEPRAAKGLEGLVHSAINGLNQMPPRGGNPAITDEEITNAVTYMTQQSGIELAAGAAPAAGAAQAAAPVAAAPEQQAAAAAPAAPAQQAAPAAPEQAAAPTAPVQAEAPAAPQAPTAPQAPEAPNGGTPITYLSGSDGETVYRSICFSCHDVGIANSPVTGDQNAWSPRLANGVDSLYGSVINGKGVMPARGGNPALTDANLKAAVDWMVAQVATSEAAPAQQAPAAPAATQAPEPAAPAAEAAAAAPVAAPAPAAGIDGEAIYKGLCFSCHDNGVANAPKPGDKAAWEPRIAKGMDALLNSALNGLNAMPARGGNPALSDDEIKAAVTWMTSR